MRVDKNDMTRDGFEQPTSSLPSLLSPRNRLLFLYLLSLSISITDFTLSLSSLLSCVYQFGLLLRPSKRSVILHTLI